MKTIQTTDLHPVILALKLPRAMWDSVMTVEKSALSNLDPMVAHMLFQILAFVWSGIFGVMLGSYLVFGVSATLHLLFIAGVCITGFVFKEANSNPQSLNKLTYSGRAFNGEHE